MERIYTQTTADYSHYPTIVPIVEGGTGSGSIQGVISAFNLISLDEIEVNVARKPSSGALSIADFSSSPTGYDVTLSGPTEISVGQIVTYTITNYDFATDYDAISNLVSNDSTIQANPGVNGELVTYKAPGVYGDYGFILKGRAYPIKVVGAAGLQPTVTQPAQNAVVGQKTIDFTATPFNDTTGTDTLSSAEWELSTDATFAASSAQGVTPVIVTNSYSSAIGLFTCNTLKTSSTYYLRVRYYGKNSRVSPWSAAVKFTTAAVFSALSVKRKLVAPTPNISGHFGRCVKLFANGTKIAIGSPGNNSAGAVNSGAVFIYDTISGALLTTLTEAVPVANHEFGYNLDISEDGVMLLVSIPGYSTSKAVGGQWVQVPVGGFAVYLMTGAAYKLQGVRVPTSGTDVFDDCGRNEVKVYSGVTQTDPASWTWPYQNLGASNKPWYIASYSWSTANSSVTHSGFTGVTTQEIWYPGTNNALTLFYGHIDLDPIQGCGKWLRAYKIIGDGVDLSIDNYQLIPDSGPVISEYYSVKNLNSNGVSVSISSLNPATVKDIIPANSTGVLYGVWGDANGEHSDEFLVRLILSPNQKVGSDFGYRVVAGNRGNSVVISAPAEIVGGVVNCGRVYIYEKPGGAADVANTAVLDPPTPAAMQFGTSISINEGCTTVVIGAVSTDFGAATDVGAVYKFSKSANLNTNGGWVFVGSFMSPTSTAGDKLGFSTSVSAGGDMLAASAPYEVSANNLMSAGAVYLLV